MPTTFQMQRRRFELMAAEHAALIGARIREAREEQHLTQSDLAGKIPGKSDGTQVSKWERGEHRVSDDTLKHIARILKHDIAWFHTSPADKSETPDLLGASGNGEKSQLDRIEALLHQAIENQARFDSAAATLNQLQALLERLAGDEVVAAVQEALHQESQQPARAGRRRAA